MIRVEVVNTFLVNMGKEFVILLKGTQDERTLPISIGQLEAQSIALQLNDIPFPRPLTHDLLKAVLTEISGTVLRTEICDLRDETFYARLVVNAAGKTMTIDSRPSDAIAMALRFSAPIYVEERVMEEAGVVIAESDEEEKENKEEPSDMDTEVNLTPVDRLRSELDIAVRNEQYERAAQIRDEIKKLSSSN